LDVFTSTVNAAADDDDYDGVICLAVGYTMDTVYFGPMDNAIDIAPDLQMPQFSLVDRKHHDCSTNYTSGIRYSAATATALSFSLRVTIRTLKLRFKTSILELNSNNTIGSRLNRLFRILPAHMAWEDSPPK